MPFSAIIFAFPDFTQGALSWQDTLTSNPSTAFEPSSKRRKGFPSETHVKRGHRVVHGQKELIEKLGRNDCCPCGSGRPFQEMLSRFRSL